MQRMKIMFASLLPLFWLAAAASGSADVPGGGTSVCGYRTSISAAPGHGQPDRSRDVYSARQALRHLNRRAGTSCDPNPGSPLFIAANTRLSGLEPVPALFSVVEAPAGLARTWRFYLRLVCEPRAPSAVS